MLELFTTSTCVRCPVLIEYLHEELHIKTIKRVIDTDPEAETDALMLNIRAVPALRKGDDVLMLKDIMDKDHKLFKKKILEFIKHH
jgi:predicted thioredoxin/glutaredoxin